MELSKYKENLKNNIACSEEKTDKFLELKKSIFSSDNLNENGNELNDIGDNNNIQKNLNLINDEFNNFLETKESKEFKNRLRASILSNNNELDNNNLKNDKNS